MRTTVIREYEHFKALKKEWNELLNINCNDRLQLTHEWVSSWWQSFGADCKMFILLIRDSHGDIAGIAPLMEAECRYRGLNIKKISLMANGHSPSCDVIAREKDREKVIEVLLDSLTQKTSWDIFDMAKIECDGNTCCTILRQLKDRDIMFGVKENIETPFIEIDNNWEKFLKTRSAKFRKTLRNKINRINAQGDIRIERTIISDSSHPSIHDMIEISSKSWKSKINNDLKSNRQVREFHMRLCDYFGKNGMVTLWVLKKNEKPIAFEFHITYKGTAYPIRADYNEEIHHLSPGSVLECHIMKTLFNEGEVRKYYSCGHKYAYLLKWTENTKRHIDIEIFNHNPRACGLYMFEYKILPILRKMRLNQLKHFCQ